MNQFFQKLIGSLAPLLWGSFVWFMGWGLGANFFLNYSVNYLIRIIIVLLSLYCFFGFGLNQAYRKHQIYFAQYPLYLPSWKYFLILVGIAASIVTLPIIKSEFLQSIFYGVIISSILEELITRSFFIKYKMNLLEFIFWNVLSSFAFMFMHGFYQEQFLDLFELLQRGHLGFSFILGIIVYKTQRIELSITVHMLSNLLRYTIPVCLFHMPWPSFIAFSGSILHEAIMILVLAFCYSKDIERFKDKNKFNL